MELRFCGSVTCTHGEDSAVCDGSKHVREINNDIQLQRGQKHGYHLSNVSLSNICIQLSWCLPVLVTLM